MINTLNLVKINCIAFYFSIKNELSEIQEKANISGGRYKQNQRFEEMRVLQGRLILFIHLVFY